MPQCAALAVWVAMAVIASPVVSRYATQYSRPWSWYSKRGTMPHRVRRWEVAMQSCMSGGGTHTESWPNLAGESGTKGNGHGCAWKVCHGTGEMTRRRHFSRRYSARCTLGMATGEQQNAAHSLPMAALNVPNAVLPEISALETVGDHKSATGRTRTRPFNNCRYWMLGIGRVHSSYITRVPIENPTSIGWR